MPSQNAWTVSLLDEIVRLVPMDPKYRSTVAAAQQIILSQEQQIGQLQAQLYALANPGSPT